MATKRKKAVKKKATNSTKKGSGVNKLGVENSLVNNINARKKKKIARPKKKSTITKKQYEAMQKGWKNKK